MSNESGGRDGLSTVNSDLPPEKILENFAIVKARQGKASVGCHNGDKAHRADNVTSDDEGSFRAAHG